VRGRGFQGVVWVLWVGPWGWSGACFGTKNHWSQVAVRQWVQAEARLGGPRSMYLSGREDQEQLSRGRRDGRQGSGRTGKRAGRGPEGRGQGQASTGDCGVWVGRKSGVQGSWSRRLFWGSGWRALSEA
jgi:hypothetical protein